jgi:hypothetical protein
MKKESGVPDISIDKFNEGHSDGEVIREYECDT